MADEQPKAPAQKQLVLQKIYVKDLSFESPKAPGIFTTNVAPQTQINIRTSAHEVAPSTHEVTLTLTVEAKDQDATVFLIEIAQAGIFSLDGYTPEEHSALLGSFCPNTLYPFAREAIADVALRGGFPQLLLQPINFDSLYARAVRDATARNGGGESATGASAGETH